MKTLTFAETLHPEDAQEHLGVKEHERGWGTVYHETMGDIPSAVARRVDEDEEKEQKEEVQQPSAAISVSETTQSTEANTTCGGAPSGKGCFFLEGLIGYSLVLAAIASTFGIELAAAIVYLIAAGFYYVTTIGNLGILFKAIFLLVVQLLVIVDALLLTVSVAVTEILGFVTCIVTAIFAQSCRTSRDWHLFIRRMCHLTRWAFRGFHKEWALERHFPVDVFDTSKDKETRQDDMGGSSRTNGRNTDLEVGASDHSPMAENVVVVDHITYKDEKM